MLDGDSWFGTAAPILQARLQGQESPLRMPRELACHILELQRRDRAAERIPKPAPFVLAAPKRARFQGRNLMETGEQARCGIVDQALQPIQIGLDRGALLRRIATRIEERRGIF